MSQIDEKLARRYAIIADGLNLLRTHLSIGLRSVVPDVTIEEVDELIEAYDKGQYDGNSRLESGVAGHTTNGTLSN